MGWRGAPELSAAEVTRVVLVVAVRAQWSHLTGCPLLAWQSIYRKTPIAEATCHQAAINAWPAERLLVTHCEHLKRLRLIHEQGRQRSMSAGLKQMATDEQLLANDDPTMTPR